MVAALMTQVTSRIGVVPGIVVAIGVYYAYSRYGLVGSPIGLVLAHSCLAVPFVVTSVSASLGGLDPRLEQAAPSLGATPFGTFHQVTLPLIRPAVLAGAHFAFITSFDELIVSLLLSGSGAVTLPRRMWTICAMPSTRPSPPSRPSPWCRPPC